MPLIPSVVQIKGEAKEGYPGERLLSEWLTNDQDIKGAFSYASNDTVFVLELRTVIWLAGGRKSGGWGGG
jgi:hypothetical protein